MPQLANGSKLHIGSAFAAGVQFNGITRGANTILQLQAANASLKLGTVVILQSVSNSALEGASAVISAVNGANITLRGVDTSNTSNFPADEAVTGQVVAVTAFVALPLTSDIATSGGDATTQTVQFIQKNKQDSYNTGRNATVHTLTMAHDSMDAARAILKTLTDSQAPTVYRVMNARALSGAGEYRFTPVTVSFNPNPVMAVNNIETVSLVLTALNDMTIISKKDIDSYQSGS